jgi:hypothetical protein
VSESTAEKRGTLYTDLVIEKNMKGKQIRSHSVFDRTTLSLKRLREMKTTWDNDKSHQIKALAKMLENLKELIKEQEEKESKAIHARRLSALDTSEMSKIVCDNICFQNNQEDVKYFDIEEKDKTDYQCTEVNNFFHFISFPLPFYFIFRLSAIPLLKTVTYIPTRTTI